MEKKLAKLQETKSTIRFSAKFSEPKKTTGAGSETILALPKSMSAKLQARGKNMVEGTINNLPFRTTLIPSSKGIHELKVSKAMRNALGAKDLDTVKVEITRVADEPETRVPMDLRKALTATPKAKASWNDITPMSRRDWIFSISTAKQSETRKRRIEKTSDMLASGKRRLCCFPGIKWLMKKNAKSCGMWLPLSSSKNRPSPKSGK